MDSLTTTNILLTILAVLGVAEAIVFIVLLGTLLFMVRHVILAVDQMHTRYVAPTAERVNAILADVQAVTASARSEVRMCRRLVRGILRWAIARVATERRHRGAGLF